MKNKYWIGLLLVVALIGCFVGFKIGFSRVDRNTIEIMIDYERFHIAARAASLISDLHKIKEKNIPSVNCQLKKIIEKQIFDCQSCKESQYCTKEVSDGYYVHTDTKIADFMALSCGD
jgi:hypothetical protein